MSEARALSRAGNRHSGSRTRAGHVPGCAIDHQALSPRQEVLALEFRRLTVFGGGRIWFSLL